MHKINVQAIRKLANKAVVAGFVSQAILVITGVVSARLLGPDGRGLLALLLVIPTVLAAIGVLGIPQALVVLSGREPCRSSDFLRAAWVTFSFQALGLITFYLVALHFVGAEQLELSWDLQVLSAVVLLLMLINNYVAATLQATSNFRQLNVLRTVPLAIYAVGLTSIWAFDFASVRSALLVWIAAYAAYFGWIGLVTRTEIGAIYYRSPATGEMRSLLRFGIRGHLGSLSTIEILQVDKLIVGTLMSSDSLGYFVVAQSFSNLPRIAVASASQIFSPSLASGLLEPQKFFKDTLLLGGTIAALGGAILIVIQPWLIPLLFGKQFSASVVTAQYLVAAGVIGAMRRFCSDSMWALGKPGAGTVSELIVCVVFGIGCGIALWYPAIEKVAAAVLAAQIIAFSYVVVQSWRYLKQSACERSADF